jgi:hypothetical protein
VFAIGLVVFPTLLLAVLGAVASVLASTAEQEATRAGDLA